MKKKLREDPDSSWHEWTIPTGGEVTPFMAVAQPNSLVRSMVDNSFVSVSGPLHFLGFVWGFCAAHGLNGQLN